MVLSWYVQASNKLLIFIYPDFLQNKVLLSWIVEARKKQGKKFCKALTNKSIKMAWSVLVSILCLLSAVLLIEESTKKNTQGNVNIGEYQQKAISTPTI